MSRFDNFHLWLFFRSSLVSTLQMNDEFHVAKGKKLAGFFLNVSVNLLCANFSVLFSLPWGCCSNETVTAIYVNVSLTLMNQRVGKCWNETQAKHLINITRRLHLKKLFLKVMRVKGWIEPASNSFRPYPEVCCCTFKKFQFRASLHQHLVNKLKLLAIMATIFFISNKLHVTDFLLSPVNLWEFLLFDIWSRQLFLLFSVTMLQDVNYTAWARNDVTKKVCLCFGREKQFVQGWKIFLVIIITMMRRAIERRAGEL